MQYLGINIDLDRDNNLTEQAFALLKDYYMLEDETSPQHAFARAAVAYCEGDYDFAQRIYDYASKRWFMFASPVLSNAPANGDEPKGLPISCFLTYVGGVTWRLSNLLLARQHLPSDRSTRRKWMCSTLRPAP